MKKIVALLFTMIAFMACKVIKPATAYSKTDETKTDYKLQKIDVKGALVATSINFDSLFNDWVDKQTSYKKDSANAVAHGLAPPPQPVMPKQILTDNKTKAQLTYWVDQFGKLQMSCESKDQTVSILVAEVTRLSKEVTQKTEVVYKIPIWGWITLTALATLLIICILIITLKHKIL